MQKGVAILIGVMGWVSIGCLSMTACGYRFVGSGGFPGGAQRIYVTVFENRTSETGLENILSRELNNEFTRRNIEGFAGRKSKADAVLTGNIHNLTIDIVSRRTEIQSAERRVSFRSDIKLTTPEGDTFWQATGLFATQTYPVIEGDNEATEASRREALRVASNRLAEVIYNRLIEDF